MEVPSSKGNESRSDASDSSSSAESSDFEKKVLGGKRWRVCRRHWRQRRES